jgi:hypothetical protein
MIVLTMKRLTQTTGRFKIISGYNSWQLAGYYKIV